jgi:hypothetical protein
LLILGERYYLHCYLYGETLTAYHPPNRADIGYIWLMLSLFLQSKYLVYRQISVQIILDIPPFTGNVCPS